MTTAIYVADILSGRAAKYGGDLADILERTPEHLWDSPSELLAFWEQKDLSHVFPQSTHPDLANDWDNIVPEDASVNRARGAEVMTEQEIDTAAADAEFDASIIENLHADDSAEFLEAILELAG